MKVLLLLPLVSSLCAALAIHDSPHEPLSNTLSKRAVPATKDNPDAEDDYVDQVTKAEMPASRILPFGENGVNQPDEAKNRIFDWDSTYQTSFLFHFINLNF